MSLDAGDMLLNLSNSYAGIIQLVTSIAFVLGMSFIIRALYHMKIYGELRTMMSTQTSIKEPLAYIFVGVMFLYFPTGVQTMMMTFFSTTTITPVSYYSGGSATSTKVMQGLLKLVQIVGLISFIRGWVHFANAAQLQARSTYGKALTHICGGIMAMNIMGVLNILQTTFGY